MSGCAIEISASPRSRNVGVAVAELPVARAAPAADVAALEQRAGMEVALDQIDRRTPELNRATGTRRLVVADVVDVAVAELTELRVAPAAHCAVVEARAAVVVAKGQLHGGAAELEGRCGAGQLVVADRRGGALPELTCAAEPPATHATGVE
jgi:hypothetical protein